MWQKFDEGMWRDYPGAQEFADGEDPWWGIVTVDGSEGLMIADATGLTLYCDMDTDTIYHLDHEDVRWLTEGWSSSMRLKDLTAIGMRP